MRLKNKIIELVKQLDNKHKNESAASNMGGLNSVTGMTYDQNADQQMAIIKNQEMQIGALKQLIVQRDKKMQDLNQKVFEMEDDKISKYGGQSVVSKSRPPLSPSKGYNANHDQLDEARNRLNMAKRQIEELKSELKSAKSIQIQQSKALTQLTNESEFPLKVKSLQEELRVAKDKNVKLTHHSTTVERNSKM